MNKDYTSTIVAGISLLILWCFVINMAQDARLDKLEAKVFPTQTHSELEDRFPPGATSTFSGIDARKLEECLKVTCKIPKK